MEELKGILHADKLTAETVKNWKETYDQFSMMDELKSASNWLQESGKKYKNYSRFYGNWLRKSAIKKTKYSNEEIKHFFSMEKESWPELFLSLGMKENEE